jgi:hypothetical protein
MELPQLNNFRSSFQDDQATNNLGGGEQGNTQTKFQGNVAQTNHNTAPIDQSNADQSPVKEKDQYRVIE